MADSTDSGDGSVQVPSDYEPARGTVPQELDMADDGHPIAEALGKSAHRELQAHEGTLGERFAFRYEQPDRVVREYLANGETGCIRAAKLLLRAHDPDHYTDEWFASRTVPQLLQEARDVVDYYPVIETHGSPAGASADRFRIEDNGIGISVEEFIVLRNLGLSASHEAGEQLGSFGQGVMSAFPAIGKHGDGTLETWSRQDDANYRMRFRIDGFNDLPGKRESPGTTWSFSAFADENSDLDVGEAVEKYATAMYVPVIHHEYDESGEEVSKEEYTYSPLDEQLLDEDDARYVYEDDAVEIVISPAIDSDDQQVYLVTQPIDAGCDLDSFNAPYPFHIRLKNESGQIYECTHDDDHEGLIPVSKQQYENELIQDREAIHPDLFVPGDIVGYDVDDIDEWVVKSGVDDELVEGLDGVTTVDQKFLPEVDLEIGNEDIDAKVVAGPHEGHAVVTEEQWHEIDSDVESMYVPEGEIDRAGPSDVNDDRYKTIKPNKDVVTPEPVDDRDRLKSHDGNFYRCATKKAKHDLIETGAELFERLAADGFDAFFDLDTHERSLLMICYENYVSQGRSEITDQVARRAIQQTFEVSIDNELATKLAVLSEKVEYADRDTTYPNKSRYREDKSVAEVLRECGAEGTVYMGATIHPDKCRLAWEMDDRNQVIATDNASKYDDYESLGWVPLRELDLRGIQEKYDVADDVAADLERDQRDVDRDYEGISMDDLDAATREIKLRSADKGSYRSTTAKELSDHLTKGKKNQDETEITDDKGEVEYVLVFNQTEVSGISVGSKACVGTISRTIVPNYVYEYLDGVEGCYLVDDGDYRDALREIESEINDITTTAYDVSNLVEVTQSLEDTDNGQAMLTQSVSFDEDGDTTVTSSATRMGDIGSETVGVMLPRDLREHLDTDDDEVLGEIVELVCESLVENDTVDHPFTQIVFADKALFERTHIVWSPIGIDVNTPTAVVHKDGRKPSVGYEHWDPDKSIKLKLLLPESRFDRDAFEWETIISSHDRAMRRDYKKGKALLNLLHRLDEYVPDDEPVLPDKQ